MTNRFDLISIDSNICHGQACIKGTRIPVHQVLGTLANGDSFEDLIEEYPSLSRESILACLEYAASLASSSSDLGNPTDNESTIASYKHWLALGRAIGRA